jgi:hypothetical protein
VATGVFTAWIVYHTYTPVLFADQWSFINRLM